MEELKPNLIKKSVFITLIYAIATLICVLHHEIWSDEAQVWLLSKHISFFGLFKHLVNEGHPSLFYLLVMPFAKLSNNIIFQQLICWFSCVVSIFLIWRYTKFSNFAKTIITISSPFIYHFPVIARNYSIIPLLIIILALLHNKSDKYPVYYGLTIALIANTHAIMFPFAALIGSYFIYKNIFVKKNRTKPFIIASILIVVGLLALIIQLVGTTQSNIAINFEGKGDFDTFVRVVMLFIFNSFDDYIIKSNNNFFTKYPLIMTILTLTAYITTFVAIFKQNKKLFCLAFLSIAAQIGIYTMTYGFFIFPTRIYCAYLIALFCFIIIKNTNAKRIIDFAVIFLFGLTIINGIKSCYGDIMYDYTPSKKTAQYILENINANNSTVFVADAGYAIAVEYYLYPKTDLWQIKLGKPLRYVVWNPDCLSTIPQEYVLAYFDFLRKNGNKKELYILIGHNPFSKYKWYDSKDLELIYKSKDALMPSEAFKLYKYKK